MSQALKNGKGTVAGKPKGGRPSYSERKATAERHRRKQRRLAYGIPSAIVVVMVVVGVVLSLGGGKSAVLPKGRVSAGGPALSQPLTKGATVPSFSAPGLSGGRVSWSDYRGSPAVLVAWAPWCPHCQKELPIMSRVAADFPSVQLVTVVTAVGEHPGPTPQQYMSDHDLTFPVAVDDAAGSIGGALGITGFPTVYYVDGSGTVVDVFVGEVPESQMRSSFAALARA
jgi:peroxiredoxin